MAKMVWDKIGERTIETGVEQVALYPMSEGTYGTGVPWNGFRSFTESPSGAEPTALYANNAKYMTLISAEDYSFSIGAYMSPPEFDKCDGSVEAVKGVNIGQQPRVPFGLALKTKVANDSEGNDYGYILHLIYGATAAPSEKSYNSINESPEAVELSWECSTTPVAVTGHKPTATITIDSRTADKSKLAELEKKLYGDDSMGTPTLPMPDEVITIMTPDEM